MARIQARRYDGRGHADDAVRGSELAGVEHHLGDHLCQPETNERKVNALGANGDDAAHQTGQRAGSQGYAQGQPERGLPLLEHQR